MFILFNLSHFWVSLGVIVTWICADTTLKLYTHCCCWTMYCAYTAEPNMGSAGVCICVWKQALHFRRTDILHLFAAWQSNKLLFNLEAAWDICGVIRVMLSIISAYFNYLLIVTLNEFVSLVMQKKEEEEEEECISDQYYTSQL